MELMTGGARAIAANRPGLQPQLRGRLLAIDFEASCLPRDGRSYPIEVGVADSDGRRRSWLIRPAPEWADWHWSAEAEALHGISRQRLAAAGLPPVRVLAELGSSVSGGRIFADSTLDDDWLRTLARAAGVRPPFRVGHFATLLDELGTTPAEMAEAEAAAAAADLRPHRAADDAARLGLMIGALAAAAGRRAGARPLERAA